MLPASCHQFIHSCNCNLIYCSPFPNIRHRRFQKVDVYWPVFHLMSDAKILNSNPTALLPTVHCAIIPPKCNMSDNFNISNDPSMSTRSLCCLIGEATVLQLEVKNSTNVFDLRKQIRSSLQHNILQDVDHPSLNLWKVRA